MDVALWLPAEMTAGYDKGPSSVDHTKALVALLKSFIAHSDESQMIARRKKYFGELTRSEWALLFEYADR